MTDLLRLLLAETTCIEQVSAVLEEQDKAIAEHRHADLAEINARLDPMVTELSRMESRREALQADLGYPPGQSGAEALGASDAQLSSAWAGLKAAAARAGELQRTAGAKVFAHLHFTDEAIEQLRGRMQPLYGPDGARRGSPSTGSARITA